MPKKVMEAMTHCEHTENCCVAPSNAPAKIGKKWATALMGFIAGGIVAATVLIPWMIVQGKFCDAKEKQSTSSSINLPELPAEAPTPNPAPGLTPAPTAAP